MGDGSYVVSLTPEAAISVGQSAIVDQLHVTVTHFEKVEDTTSLSITPENHLYWSIDFTLENVSDKEKYPHPLVDSQLQYIVNGQYIWETERYGNCMPSVKDGIPPLAPEAKFECKLIYFVPDDEQPVYWVYTSTGYEEYVVFRVR